MSVLPQDDTMLRLIYWALILGFVAVLIYLVQDPGLQALVRGWMR